MKISIVWDETLCSPLKAKRIFGWIYRHDLQVASSVLVASCYAFLSYLLALKIEAVCYTETSIIILWTTLRRYIPEDSILLVEDGPQREACDLPNAEEIGCTLSLACGVRIGP
jgi:hypothetical protein